MSVIIEMQKYVWAYITHQSEGLGLWLYDTVEEAESVLLCDMEETFGYALEDPAEIESVLEDAHSDKGFEMTANKIGTDDITMYIRKEMFKMRARAR